MTPLEQAVVKTLTWFGLFNHPLTAFECWQYLNPEGEALGTITPGQVMEALQNLKRQGVVSCTLGFWQLANSEPLLTIRQQRARWAIPKYKRAQRGARLISYLPFVRLVALGNSVAFDAPRQAGSDIDLLIVAAPGRLFLARFFVTLVLQLRGWRRHGAKVRDRLCLSFYLTEDSLSLKPFARADDPYLQFWLATLRPLVDSGEYQKLLVANSWVSANLPHLNQVPAAYCARASAPSPVAQFIQRAWEGLFPGRFGNAVERAVRGFTLPRMLRYVGPKQNDGTGDVVISNQVIKMHLSDRRQELALAFRGALTARAHRVL